MITQEQHNKVIDRVHQCMFKAGQHYGKSFVLPVVEWTLRGTNAGKAQGKGRISLQPVLFEQNEQDFFSDTIPHECAHLIAWEVYGYGIAPHGSEWQSVMTVLGVDPRRCHQYDVSDVYTPKDPQQKVPYVCACPGKTHMISTRMHKHILQGHWRKCKICQTRIVGDVNATTYASNEVVTPLVLRFGTKQKAADHVFRKFFGQKSSVVIEMIKSEVGMSHAGATTYFYTLKKKYKTVDASRITY